MQKVTPWNWIFEVVEIQKSKTPMGKVERVDEKIGVNCLLPCLLQELWLKHLKWLIVCIFCWSQEKISHNFSKHFKCIWKTLFSSFRKFYGLLGSISGTISKMSTLKNTGFQIFSYISTLSISWTVTPKPINIPFSERN